VLLDGVHAVLHRAIRAAWRRKALEPVGVPFGVVALAGRATALPCINRRFIQVNRTDTGMPYVSCAP
jgi:hypothetical protein